MNTPKNQKNSMAFWLATWLGAGLMRPAPGTWGSAAALPFGLIIFKAGGPLALIVATAIIFRVGVWAAEKLDEHSGTHDNSMIVIDEVAGQWLSLVPALLLFGFSPLAIFMAFLFFRLFDILKPWPVCDLDQKLKGGLGVMADDIAAGLYAALCITIIYAGLNYAGLG